MRPASVSPPLRVRLLVVVGVLLSIPAVLFLSAPVPTTQETADIVFRCGPLVVPNEGKRVVVASIGGSGVPCDEARAVVTDSIRGRDVGARRGFACQVVPGHETDGRRTPGFGDCQGWDGGEVFWSLK